MDAVVADATHGRREGPTLARSIPPVGLTVAAIAERAAIANGLSGVIHITEGERTLHSSAYGFANRSESIPNDPTTRFAQASGSKTFTACAVARLVETGCFSFDTCVASILEVWPPQFSPEVTVHHLLSHTSGIADYFDEESEDDDDWLALWEEHPTYTIRGPSDLLPLFRDGTPKFAPGARFSYCNSGYVALGLLIEQHARMPFSDFVRREVLETVGMNGSGYFALDALPSRTALNYLTGDDPDSLQTNLFAVPAHGQPDGGAFVTAPDMAMFWRAIRSGGVLAPETVEAMMTPHARVDGTLRYGYGMWISQQPDGSAVHYAEGCDPGVGFLSALWAERDATVTVISNTDGGVWPIFTEIIDALAQGPPA